jgi:hypothetical protein
MMGRWKGLGMSQSNEMVGAPQAYQDLLRYSHRQLWDLLTRSYRSIEAIYEEHLRVLSLLATMALGLQYSCGIYTLRPERHPTPGWSHALVIDLPSGQLCWLIPQEKLHYFREMPIYKGVWRGIPRMDNQLYLLLNPQLPFQPYRTEKIHSFTFPPLEKEQ